MHIVTFLWDHAQDSWLLYPLIGRRVRRREINGERRNVEKAWEGKNAGLDKTKKRSVVPQNTNAAAEPFRSLHGKSGWRSVPPEHGIT
jgi:hypothetical protein